MLLVISFVAPPLEANEPFFGNMNSETKKLDEARKIISTYGRDGRLSRIDDNPELGLTAYINNQEFKAIFKNSTRQLSYDDWFAGFLFCQPTRNNPIKIFECKSDSTSDLKAAAEIFKADFGSDLKNAMLTEKLLYENNRFWKAYVDLKTQTHWEYVSKDLDMSWEETKVVVYLNKTEEINTSRVSVDSRMEKLKAIIKSTNNGAITENVDDEILEEFFYQEVFEKADIDQSNTLDIYEAKKAFPVENFLESFLVASKAKLNITRDDYDNIDTGKINAYIFSKVFVALTTVTLPTTIDSGIGSPPEQYTLSILKDYFKSQFTNE